MPITSRMTFVIESQPPMPPLILLISVSQLPFWPFPKCSREFEAAKKPQSRRHRGHDDRRDQKTGTKVRNGLTLVRVSLKSKKGSQKVCMEALHRTAGGWREEQGTWEGSHHATPNSICTSVSRRNLDSKFRARPFVYSVALRLAIDPPEIL
ncbi:hypothetical protein C8J57DRAFT_1227689 [Mycena rebaudengoi]|nr:hypothetical protein C8J57DRAFT_1227689 [Mycena rebaudengoi]